MLMNLQIPPYLVPAIRPPRFRTPNAGLGEDDGIVNVLNGESTDDLTQGSAERGQNYSWSSVGYGDWMYVGTCYSAMGSTLKYMANTMGTKYASIKAALDVAFNGELFLDNGENHSLLLKINVKTGEVKIIVNAIGGEHAVNGYRAAVEFHGASAVLAGAPQRVSRTCWKLIRTVVMPLKSCIVPLP